MNNCLVTKLKSVVTNDKLYKLGMLYIACATQSNSTARKINIKVDSTCKANVEGGLFTNADGTGNIGTEVVFGVPNQLYSLYVSNNECVVTISDKYAIKEIIIENPALAIVKDSSSAFGANVDNALEAAKLISINTYGGLDLSAFKGKYLRQLDVKGESSGDITGLTVVRNIAVTGKDIIGKCSFADLSAEGIVLNGVNFTNTGVSFTTADFNSNLFVNATASFTGSSNISGLISDLAKVGESRASQALGIKGTGITGSVESLIEAKYGHQIDGQIQFVVNDKVTLNGNKMNLIDFGGSPLIIFSGNTVTIKNPAKTITYATYDGTNWSY